MKKIYGLSIFFALIGGLYLCMGCTDEGSSLGTDGLPNGLVLELKANGQEVTPNGKVPSEHSLREDVVEDVNVFFFKANEEQCVHYYHRQMDGNGKVFLETGKWKDKYQEAVYDIYVIANIHSYDNPITPSILETDLSWITTRTALKALKDKDVDIFKAEGDKFSSDEIYRGKKFLMDGRQDGWNSKEQSDNAMIEINLSRAAAKVVVNVSYTEGFLQKDREVIDVRKKIVRYAENSYICMESGVIPIQDLKGEANSDYMSQSYSTEGIGISRKDRLYAYSYPNEWGNNISDKETYILLNIPYKENAGGSEIVKTVNYYKVPIRISKDVSDLCLERNTIYTVNVTIDRLGNEEMDRPVELTPLVTIAPWKEKFVDIDSEPQSYLMVSEKNLEMHNVADTMVTFFSTTPIKAEVTEAYYIDKNGNRKNINKTQGISIKYNNQVLEGKIEIHSDIPTNITARYITLKVTNSDQPSPLTREIHIIQYPLEYISGIPGVYATRDDYTDNTYENYKQKKIFSTKPIVAATFGNYPGISRDSYQFESKVYEGSVIYNVNVEGKKGNFYLARGKENPAKQNNNRMYLVQITSTSKEYIVARPATEMDKGQLVTVSSQENNRLVSPFFMLASQLGTVKSIQGGGTWQGVRDHCKYYVEVVEYSDKTIRTFNNWRLPTEAELSVIANYQKTQPDVMDLVLGGKWYWTALENAKYTVPDGTLNATGVRCIRDVTPQELADFRIHGIN